MDYLFLTEQTTETGTAQTMTNIIRNRFMGLQQKFDAFRENNTSERPDTFLLC